MLLDKMYDSKNAMKQFRHKITEIVGYDMLCFLMHYTNIK